MTWLGVGSGLGLGSGVGGRVKVRGRGRVRLDLHDDLPVGHHHGHAAEERLEVLGQLLPAGVARVHRDEEADLVKGRGRGRGRGKGRGSS